METKVIGIGAAGNKAAIALIEQEILDASHVMLLNSTLRDVPLNYKAIAKKFSDTLGGCGKERKLAQQFMINALQNDVFNLEGFIDPKDDMIIIASSSEGGTGCGASIVLAEYIHEVLSIPVHMFVFTGFEEDARGLANTVEYFQELDSSFTVQAISNKKFLDETGNKLRAEKEANNAFASKVRTIMGIDLVDSTQNIDETDLKKIVNTPGFMVVETVNITSKLKNTAMFNELCASLIDNTSSLDFDPSAKRIGVILNIGEKTKDFIDYSFSTLKSKLGSPFELYTHIQSENDPEFISVIASGINLPIEDIEAVYNKYMEESSKVEKKKDAFFSKAKGFTHMEEDSIFDSATKRMTNKLVPDASVKKSFFNKFNKTNNYNFNNILNERAKSQITTQQPAATVVNLSGSDIENV